MNIDIQNTENTLLSTLFPFALKWVSNKICAKDHCIKISDGPVNENQGCCRETIGCTEGQQQRQWQQTHIPNFNGDIKIR